MLERAKPGAKIQTLVEKAQGGDRNAFDALVREHGDRARGLVLRLLKMGGPDIDADDATGRAHWVATYTFAATGRRVVNRVDATFVFRDGLIREHRDRFDLHRWMRQALGWKGLLLGWLPAAQASVRTQARRALEAWPSPSGGREP